MLIVLPLLAVGAWFSYAAENAKEERRYMRDCMVRTVPFLGVPDGKTVPQHCADQWVKAKAALRAKGLRYVDLYEVKSIWSFGPDSRTGSMRDP
jgi:hypothetical protein